MFLRLSHLAIHLVIFFHSHCFSLLKPSWTSLHPWPILALPALQPLSHYEFRFGSLYHPLGLWVVMAPGPAGCRVPHLPLLVSFSPAHAIAHSPEHCNVVRDWTGTCPRSGLPGQDTPSSQRWESWSYWRWEMESHYCSSSLWPTRRNRVELVQ